MKKQQYLLLNHSGTNQFQIKTFSEDKPKPIHEEHTENTQLREAFKFMQAQKDWNEWIMAKVLPFYSQILNFSVLILQEL